MFRGQIINTAQAQRMLSLSEVREWSYSSYEKFYSFMESLTEEERDVIILKLFKK